MFEQSISMERMEEAVNLFGSFDENIRILEESLRVTVVSRDSELKVSGEPENVMLAVKAIQGLLALSTRGESINEQNVRYVLELVRAGAEDKIGEIAADVLCVTAKGKPIKAKTIGQKKYVEAIAKNAVTLGVGPRRHGQDLSGGGRRRGRLPGQAGQPHHFDPPRCGGGGAAGLPSRRPAEQGGPLPAAPLRRAV